MVFDYKIKDSLKATKILIIEDDAVMIRLLRDVLKVMGFGEITVAPEGNKALALVASNNFDLIFCDWRMKGMSGLDFTKALRAHPNHAKSFTPIIMLTGNARPEDIITARDAGVTEYMIKPFSVKSLCSKVKTIVENPRLFVLADDYKGPDRRQRDEPEKIPETGDRREGENVVVKTPEQLEKEKQEQARAQGNTESKEEPKPPLKETTLKKKEIIL